MLCLSHREVRSLSAFIEVLCAPLTFPDSRTWRREVISRGKDLVSVDRAVFGLGWEGTAPIEDEGLDPGATPAYIQYYHQFDRGHEERRRQGRPVAGIRHEITSGWPLNAEFRHDFLGRFRLDAGAGMAHDVAPGAPNWCAFYPGTEAPARFEEHAVPLLELAFPAFRAGVDTLFRFRSLRTEFARLLDQVSDGFMLADGQGRILHRNPALQRMLASDPESRLLEHALDTLVRRFSACVGDAERGLGLFRTVPVVTHHAAYDLIPTIAGHDLKHVGVDLIVQMVSRTPCAVPAAVIRERLGLTVRESEVTCCLIQGMSYKRIAQQLGVSIDTVRSHIRSVYSKLKVHNVAEAVGRVRAGIGASSTG